MLFGVWVGFSSLICAARLAVCRLRVLSVMFAFLSLGLIDLVGGCLVGLWR